MSSNFQEAIFRELEKYFAPFQKLIDGDAVMITDFFEKTIGWKISEISSGNTIEFVNAVNTVVTNIAVIEDIYKSPPKTFADFAQSTAQLATLINHIKALKDAISGGGVPPFINELTQDIFEKLTVIYLINHKPIFFQLFVAFDFIEFRKGDFEEHNDIIIKGYDVNPKLHFSRITDFIKAPKLYLANRFIPNGLPDQQTATAAGKKIFGSISFLLNYLEIKHLVGRGLGPVQLSSSDEEQLDGMLTVSKQFFLDTLNSTTELGATFGIIPESQNGPGVFIVPYGNLDISANIAQWNMRLITDADIPGFEINKNGIQVYDNSGKKNVQIELLLKKISESEDVFLIGSVDGTHIKAGGTEIAALLSVMDTVWESDISVRIKDAAFVFKPGEADNFLRKIVPEDGITAEFELVIGYNSHRGLYFLGGGGLEVEIPIHKTILGIDFESLILSVNVNQDGTIPISATTSFNFAKGPLTLTVQRIGMRSDISFPANGGNLGPVNMSMGFKAPSGIGIAINSDFITGGGFLNFDEATATYTGGLELTFSRISLKAIGILSTRMPDGSDGYSLLIIITSEFTPLQLGMGFTLNGVGGLLGLNRTVNTSRLSQGVRDNTLNSILFPKDIVRNANSIISNINQVFPAKNDRFLIGPMAKIGWGTPTLLTIDLGIVIEMPNPVTLAILGVVRAFVPSESNKIIAIQVNFVGVIDFGKKNLFFRASLFDSRILTFGLYGDMAVSLSWGDRPNFLISVGGFHPEFKTPPSDLPSLRRLTVVLADSDNLKVRIETYMALTSNSAQLGAKIEAMARAWKIRAEGRLGFDVLFQFSPFHFKAGMYASFAIKMGGSTMFSVGIDFTLEGPGPWRAKGKASFRIVFVRVNVSFNATFGAERVQPIAPINVFPKLQEAITNKENWIVNKPQRDIQFVVFREIPDSETNLVVDPYGTLQFGQKALPLNVTLQKYGSSRINDYDRFKVTGVELAQGGNVSPGGAGGVYDYFARNEFFHMTDHEKLSLDSYERYISGFAVSNTDKIKSEYSVHREIRYKQIFIDRRDRFPAGDSTPVSAEVFRGSIRGNHITNSVLSPSSGQLFDGGPKKTSLKDELFRFVDRNTASVVASEPTDFKSYTLAKQYLDELLITHPAQASEYIIVNQFEM